MFVWLKKIVSGICVSSYNSLHCPVHSVLNIESNFRILGFKNDWWYRGGKIILPLAFWVLRWDPCNKRLINKRKKKQRNLLTCIPHVHIGETE